MATDYKKPLDGCETLMLDMDGTLLDLAYDNYMWLTHVPEAYARRHELPHATARQRLLATFKELEGTLDWYCFDHWSDRLELDILALHKEQQQKIRYLPGAEGFLKVVSASEIRVLMVTNSHRDALTLKAEVTGLDEYFDGIYSSHDVGYAKEDQPFWRAIAEKESFDPESTVFIDDTVSVLQSAELFGIRNLLHVTRPDTGRPERMHPDYPGIGSVADLNAREGRRPRDR